MGRDRGLLRLGFFFFYLQALLFIFPLHTPAADRLSATPWEIAADRISYQQEPKGVVAEGNVFVKQQEPAAAEKLIIRADRLYYDIEQDMVDAAGDLSIMLGDDKVTAEKGMFNLESQTGSFHDATMFRAENNLHLSGRLLEKTGAQTYHFEDSWLTTCPVTEDKPPPWSIHSADTRITVEGYARLKHASFQIRNTPVFYLPYLLLPANSSRKTGFLFPEFSQSERNGAGLLTPFFIDLSPSSDITLYPGYLAKRGPMGGVEWRYVADYRSLGIFAFNFLADRTEDTPADDYKEDGFLRTNHDRYWFRGKADHDFGNNLFGRLDLDLVSDRDYLQEFYGGLIGFGKANDDFLEAFQRGFQTESIQLRENTLQLSKIWPSMDLNGELRLINDARHEPTVPTPLWALPSLAFSGEMPIRQTPLDLVWESEYVYYWREKGLGAHRLDLHPRLVSPLPLGAYLDAIISGGVRETLYLAEVHDDAPPADWSGDHGAERTLYDIDLSVNTTLVRDYAIPFGPPAPWRHMVRPEIGYTYIPAANQDHLPELDDTDRIAARDWISYGINNYLAWMGSINDKAVSPTYSSLKISQVYDNRADQHPFSDLLVKFAVFPFNDFTIQYETSISMYGRGATHYNLKSRYADSRDNRFILDYRYKKRQDMAEPYFFLDEPADSVHELNADLAIGLTNKLSARFDINHSFSANRVVRSSYHLIYHPACWSLEMVATDTEDDFGVMLVFSLSGIGGGLEFGVPGL